MNTENTQSTEQNAVPTAQNAARQPSFAAGALWASAFVLAALTVMQAGKMPGNAAYAASATTGEGGMSSATIATGLGPDNKPYEALWVVDNRNETMAVYYIENANNGEKSLQLRFMQSLPALFQSARGSP